MSNIMMSPPASSGQRPRRCRGSLEYEQRRPAADELLDAPVNWDTVDYVIDCVVWAVSYACYDGETWLAPMLKTAFFCDFAQSIIRRSGVPVPVILTCLAYVEKASRVMEPMPIDWACERVFLGALLLAARSTAEYRHYDDSWWARLTGVLSASDVGNIDYDFRQLIGYDFQVHEHDVIKHCDAIVDRCGQQAGYWSNPPFAEDRLRYTQHASPMGSRYAYPSSGSSTNTGCASLGSYWNTCPVHPGSHASPSAVGDWYRDEVAEPMSTSQLPPFRYPELPDTEQLPPIRDLLPPHIKNLLPPGPSEYPRLPHEVPQNVARTPDEHPGLLFKVESPSFCTLY
ncbi:uncharacterized protein C8Q71DRAFT_852284 [Rhodofomes roseus]|uniref:Cyclin N-terminal domain-containing protein n=1 Tax=Rhodofomes roseus TaxID=34475 RepID=A0ABQ8KXG7_9APHY|nr:uncharacterized protein C8Q71DRAFT_852284 [Rhodofomes roseus]KAH9843759.1 hypothetical protein C8Q71DRAFT_852284 [Rhodofomes roseus]